MAKPKKLLKASESPENISKVLKRNNTELHFLFTHKGKEYRCEIEFKKSVTIYSRKEKVKAYKSLEI